MNEIHIKSDAKYIDIHHNDVVNVDISTKKSASEDLEEAANNYADKHGFRVPYDGSNNFYDDVDVKASKEGFIAGANWQEEKDNICYEEIFEDGASWKYEQMMKNAIDADARYICGEGTIFDPQILPDEIEVGQKVKLIIIKED